LVNNFYYRLNDQIVALDHAREAAHPSVIRKLLIGSVFGTFLPPLLAVFLIMDNDGKHWDEAIVGILVFMTAALFAFLMMGDLIGKVKRRNYYTRVLNDPRVECLDTFRQACDTYMAYRAEYAKLEANVAAGLTQLDALVMEEKCNERLKRSVIIDKRGCELQESFKNVALGELEHQVTEHLIEDVDRRKADTDEAITKLEDKLKVAKELGKLPV